MNTKHLALLSSLLMSSACVIVTDGDGESGDETASESSGDGESGSETGDTGSDECTVINVNTWFSADDGSDTILGEFTPNIGESTVDSAQIERWGATPLMSDIDLGSGDNANYETCDQCVRAFQDINNDGIATKQFFQESGTIRFDVISEGAGPKMWSGTLTDVRLVEVTLDPDSFASTPVEGGDCLILSGDFSTLAGDGDGDTGGDGDGDGGGDGDGDGGGDGDGDGGGDGDAGGDGDGDGDA